MFHEYLPHDLALLTSAHFSKACLLSCWLLQVREMAGFVYNPLTGRWSLSDDISVNFIAFGTKNCQQIRIYHYNFPCLFSSFFFGFLFLFWWGDWMKFLYLFIQIMMGRSNTFTTNIDFYMGHYFIMNNARDNATFITSSGGSINFFSWCSLRNLNF